MQLQPHEEQHDDENVITNKLNELLYEKVNNDRRLHVTEATVERRHFLRFSASGGHVTLEKVTEAVKIFEEIGEKVLALEINS